MTKMAKNEVNKKLAKTEEKKYFFFPGDDIDSSHGIQRRLIYHEKIKYRQLRIEGAENDQKWPKMRI